VIIPACNLLRPVRRRTTLDQIDDRAQRSGGVETTARVGTNSCFRSDELLSFLDRIGRSVLDTAETAPARRTKRFAWAWAYAAEAALIAHHRTGDTRFLDWLASTFTGILRYRDCEICVRDTYRGRITNSWGDGAYKEGHWLTHVSVGGRITYPALEFSRTMLADPHRYAVYQDVAHDFVAACAAAADEYAEDLEALSNGWRYYMLPLKDEVEAFNHVHSLVNAQIVLFELTGEIRFRDRALAALNVWRSAVETTGTGAYRWRLRPKWLSPKGRAAPEYTWKAQVTIQSPRLAYRAGICFGPDDMEALAASFTDLIYDGEMGVHERMEARPKYLVTIEHPEASRVTTITGFLYFAEFRPHITEIVQSLIAGRRDIFPCGWLSTASTSRGYAWMLNRSSTPPLQSPGV
jgi:hypothetical protein